jgi:hypothetical protein
MVNLLLRRPKGRSRRLLLEVSLLLKLGLLEKLLRGRLVYLLLSVSRLEPREIVTSRLIVPVKRPVQG